MLNKIYLTAFCSFAFATQAWAEAGHGETADPHAADATMADYEGHGAEHASSGGLPQFDPAWFPSQLFWLAVTFALLYVIFAKKTLFYAK